MLFLIYYRSIRVEPIQWQQMARNGKEFFGVFGLDSVKDFPILYHNFFPSHAYLCRRRKKALIWVRNRRYFENSDW